MQTDERLDHLAHVLTLFSVRETADHPDAAAWADQQAREVLDLRGDDVDLRAAAWQGGYIMARLTCWLREGLPADGLRPHDRSDRERLRDGDNLVGELDSDGKPLTVRNLVELLVERERAAEQRGSEE